MRRVVQIYDVKQLVRKSLKRLNKRLEKESPSIWNDEDGIRMRIRMLKAGVTLWHGSALGRKARKEYSESMTDFWAAVLGNNNSMGA